MTIPELSLCMIVKNEEKNLSRCLDSVKTVVDEIILVDTGSTDNTEEIALQYGASILKKEWQDDFSKARNQALAKATGDWILYLDADEELSPEAGNLIKKIINTPDVEGYLFKIVNYTEQFNNSSQLIHQSCRLFRNRDCYQFQGKIHEQILSSIYNNKPNAQIIQTDLIIYHYGYRSGNPERQQKIKRNLRILKQEQKKYDNNAFLEYHLGQAYHELGQLQEALNWFKKSYQHLEQTYAFTPTVIRNIGLCLCELNKYEEAKAFLDRESKNFKDYTELYYLNGLAHYQLQEYSRAIKLFEKCLLSGDDSQKYTSSAGTDSFLAHYQLGLIYQDIYNKERSRFHFREALKLESDFKEPFYPLVKLIKEKYYNNSQKVIEYLELEYNFEKKYGLALLADLCASLNEDQLTLNYLERIKETQKLTSDLKILYARSLLGVGQFTSARKQLLELTNQNPKQPSLILELCLAQWLKNPRESIKKIDSELLSNINLKMRHLLLCIDKLWVPDDIEYFKTSISNIISKIPWINNRNEQKPLYPSLSSEYLQPLLKIMQKCLRYGGIDFFETIIPLLQEMDLDKASIHFYLGELYYNHGYFQKSADELLSSLDYDIVSEKVYFYLGNIFEQSGLFTQAENLYCHALNNNDQNLAYHLAATRVSLKKAKKVAREVLKITPESEFFNRELVAIEQCLQELI